MLWLTLAYMLLDVLDSFTTFMGGRIGLAETNPYGVVILDLNPMLFYAGSTMYCLATGIMLVLIAQFHPKMFRLSLVTMLVLMLVKAHPVVYNIIQIAIKMGWIK